MPVPKAFGTGHVVDWHRCQPAYSDNKSGVLIRCAGLIVFNDLLLVVCTTG